ncbi:CaiB/BaiF CoA transferase family protein [Amycolatopsis australiensis]|uniref:Alpha-methylacyl-CoA racemase n=1 Tax=Amycolatopsis australiensis TaxID=546364 RepID=A0A1K1RGT3_9PSEU|nr:CaiB/BaiF CoA-transferase family protein [Amycolatopsis australiensis]SFW71076.1 alpha-methylacyl-CoA racemase [Amycolatopsis australiensis]
MTRNQRALTGIRVLDLSRLAPGPYCSMLLADLGAEVVMVGGGRTGAPIPVLRRGKHAIELDLKTPEGRAVLDRMVEHTDVLIESFRPGVAARLGADHDRLSRINPRLVSCSLTGYGQDGPLAQRAGHDINYLAVAGALGTFGAADAPPTPPLNLLADFGGGGLLAAFGILAALHERERSGAGQHVDAAMVDGVLSMMAMPFADWGTPTLPARGTGALTGTMPAYRTYECADGRYVAVGALEPRFFAALWTELGLGNGSDVPDHLDPAAFPELTRTLAEVFRGKDRDSWAAHFAESDACVTPVLEPDELAAHPHVTARHPDFALDRVPAVPRLSRTPAAPGGTPDPEETVAVLGRFGLTPDEAARVVAPHDAAAGDLSWPPITRPHPGSRTERNS